MKVPKVRCRIYQNGSNFAKRRLRIALTSRPAVFRYTVADPTTEGGKLTAWFVRTGADEYDQMTPNQIQLVLQWMANHEVTPDAITISQVHEAWDTPTIHQPTMEQPPDPTPKSPGGIILPA